MPSSSNIWITTQEGVTTRALRLLEVICIATLDWTWWSSSLILSNRLWRYRRDVTNHIRILVIWHIIVLLIIVIRRQSIWISTLVWSIFHSKILLRRFSFWDTSLGWDIATRSLRFLDYREVVHEHVNLVYQRFPLDLSLRYLLLRLQLIILLLLLILLLLGSLLYLLLLGFRVKMLVLRHLDIIDFKCEALNLFHKFFLLILSITEIFSLWLLHLIKSS
jgi:hypothetical protein